MLLLQHLLVLVCPIDCGLLRLPRGARLRTHHLNVPEFYRHRFALVNHLLAVRRRGGACRPGRRSPSWTSSPRSVAANHSMPRLDGRACAMATRGPSLRTVGRRAGHACAGRDRRTDRLGPPGLSGSTAGRSSARLFLSIHFLHRHVASPQAVCGHGLSRRWLGRLRAVTATGPA